MSWLEKWLLQMLRTCGSLRNLFDWTDWTQDLVTNLVELVTTCLFYNQPNLQTSTKFMANFGNVKQSYKQHSLTSLVLLIYLDKKRSLLADYNLIVAYLRIGVMSRRFA